jgi:hypothetical protein
MIGDTEFRGARGANVRVTRGTLFTVVSVNGVDVYFHRFTGEIDQIRVSRVTPAARPSLS